MSSVSLCSPSLQGILDALEKIILQKTASPMLRSLVGSEMCIRDRSGPKSGQVVIKSQQV